MHHRLDTALSEALIQAHLLMGWVRDRLMAVMARAERRRLRAGLRLAEAFLRRAICLLAADMADELPPKRPPRPRPPAPRPRPQSETPRRRGFALIERWPDFTLSPPPGNAFAGMNDHDLVPGAPLAARLGRLTEAMADPVRLARRLALWRRRNRRRPLLPLAPALLSTAARETRIWLREVDRAMGTAFASGPG